MNVSPLRQLVDWAAMGYRVENVVEVPGAMGRRGGIIDIWPPTSESPVRLEFFGDTVESLRFFDPATQRSISKLDSLFIGPAAELLAPHRLDRRALEDVLRGLDLSDVTSDVRQQFEHDTELFLDGQA